MMNLTARRFTAARHACRRRMVSGSNGVRAAAGGAVQHMSVHELRELLSVPELAQEVQLVDVREPGEFGVAKLPQFKLMPLSEAPVWSPSITEHLDPEAPTVVLCHHGVRSMQMCMFLASKGFQDVRNVTGGIDAYSQIDPSVPRY